LESQTISKYKKKIHIKKQILSFSVGVTQAVTRRITPKCKYGRNVAI